MYTRHLFRCDTISSLHLWKTHVTIVLKLTKIYILYFNNYTNTSTDTNVIDNEKLDDEIVREENIDDENVDNENVDDKNIDY